MNFKGLGTKGNTIWIFTEVSAQLHVQIFMSFDV